MGHSGIEWLMATVEAVLQAGRNLDFTKHLREGNKAFMAQRCSNEHGRFLTVTEYGGGGRRSVVVIPEGYEGLGWEKFAAELHRATNMLFAYGSKKENQKKNENINLEVNHKDPSTSTVARQSYAAALKIGHASRVHSEGIGESGLQITPQNQFVTMHNSLKEMETQLVELKAAIAFLSTKIDLLSAGGNRVVRNKTKIGPNPLNSYEGKQKIGFGLVPIPRSRRIWRVRRKSGLFEMGSTSGIGVETSAMECHSPQVTSVPEETMAPSSELKENGVIPLVKGPIEVAHKGSPEVKGLDVIPLERTNGVAVEVRDLNMDLALVPCVKECLESGVQSDTVSGDIVAPLVSLPPIADWILPKVNKIQQFLGISHGGCENQFKELINAIETSQALETKSSFKKSRELQCLFSTINYDTMGGNSIGGKSKGRAL